MYIISSPDSNSEIGVGILPFNRGENRGWLKSVSQYTLLTNVRARIQIKKYFAYIAVIFCYVILELVCN